MVMAAHDTVGYVTAVLARVDFNVVLPCCVVIWLGVLWLLDR